MSPSKRVDTFAGRLGRSIVVVLAISLALFLLVNVLVTLKLGKADKVDLTLAPDPSGGGANYLLIGSDTREFVSEDPTDDQRFGDAGGQRSDTIMVLHTDPDSERALLVSFPRDLWVDIPGQGSAKLNAAFNNGPQSVIDTLSSNFNVPVHNYAEVNFESFRQVVDAIGTVPVFFPAPARDEFSTLNIPVPGCMQLDGAGALAFVRSRNLELFNSATGDWETADPIPDIGRIGRQQALLRVIGQRAMDKALTNPFAANSIADAAISQLTIDSGFGRGDVFALADGFASSEDEPGPATLVIPTEGATRGGQSVLETTGDSESVLAQLRDFDTVIESDAGDANPAETRVRVLNGSGVEGAAAEALEDLEGIGFVGAGTGNADERGVTEVRYTSGAEDKADLVASVIDGEVETVEDDSIQGADVVVVIGGSFEGVIRTASAAPVDTGPASAQPPQPASLAPVPGDC